MMRRFTRWSATLIASALTIGGVAACSSSGSPSGNSGSSSSLSGSITVFAASSLKEAFTTLGDQFMKAHSGTTVTFNFDASSTLAEDITQGQKSDVFASASPKNMDT